jgi:hypothetical protein
MLYRPNSCANVAGMALAVAPVSIMKTTLGLFRLRQSPTT